MGSKPCFDRSSVRVSLTQLGAISYPEDYQVCCLWQVGVQVLLVAFQLVPATWFIVPLLCRAAFTVVVLKPLPWHWSHNTDLDACLVW